MGVMLVRRGLGVLGAGRFKIHHKSMCCKELFSLDGGVIMV